MDTDEWWRGLGARNGIGMPALGLGRAGRWPGRMPTMGPFRARPIGDLAVEPMTASGTSGSFRARAGGH